MWGPEPQAAFVRPPVGSAGRPVRPEPAARVEGPVSVGRPRAAGSAGGLRSATPHAPPAACASTVGRQGQCGAQGTAVLQAAKGAMAEGCADRVDHFKVLYP